MSGKSGGWLFRLQDMIDGMNFIRKTLVKTDKGGFLSDEVLRRAVERAFEIIGEAARFVPPDIQKKYDNVEWSDIIGMRHKISHDYLEINPETLWDVYDNDFFGLEGKLQIILEKEDK